MGRRIGRVLGVVLALLCLAPTAALAQTSGSTGGLSAEDLGLEVAVGYGGRVIGGRWTPVEVTMSPTRLFAGDVGVVVETNTGRMVENREVEVAAGSTKVFRFLVPPAHSLRVQVAATGEDDGLHVQPRIQRSDTFLVGVLGDDVPADARPIVSRPLDQRGTLVGVHPSFLERSSRALDPLSALVVTPEDLAGLDERTSSRLEAAIAAGIDLVVVPTVDGALDLGLPWVSATAATTVQVRRDDARQAARVLEPGPLAWTLSPADLGWSDDTRPVATAVNAGKGRVIVAGLPLGEGPLGGDDAYWGRLLQANTPVGNVNSGNEPFDRIGQTAGEGLRSDDVSLPAMPVIALSLVLYLLLVGPVNGFVLARIGRRELAWATIPALTVVFTAGAFVASAGAESSVGLSGRAAYWIDGHGTQLHTAALRAPRPGDHELVFAGEDWDVAPATWSQAPAVVERRGGDTVMSMSLEALQVGTATAHRDLDTAPPLSLDLDPTTAGAKVTVTNTSSAVIDDLRVRAGTLVVRHGSLAAGDSAVLELDRDTLPVVRDWHDNFAGLRDAQGTVSAPRSLEALLRWAAVDGNPGIVWATGTVDGDVGLGAPRADGSRTDDQGSFVAVGITAGVPGTETLPWEVDRRLLTTGFGDAWRPGPLAVEGRIEAVLRYRLPNEGAVGTLVSTLDRGQLDGMFQDAGGFREPPVEQCRTVEERDEAGNLVSTFEECTIDAIEIRPGIDGGGLEVYDHAAREWSTVDEAFVDGIGRPSLVSALGEVYVRAVGELHPFDFSGRGIGATRA